MHAGAGPGDTAGDGSDDRGVSEFTGVAILVATTVLVTASVGVFVLVGDDTVDGEVDANFSFQYIEDSSVLIITFDRGTEMRAGNMTVRGERGEATWAELAGTNESTMIGPTSPRATVQISRRNAFDERVSSSETVRIFHTRASGNETELDRWDGQ